MVSERTDRIWGGPDHAPLANGVVHEADHPIFDQYPSVSRKCAAGIPAKTDNGSILNGIKVPYHQTLSTCVRGQVLEVDKFGDMGP